MVKWCCRIIGKIDKPGATVDNEYIGNDSARFPAPILAAVVSLDSFAAARILGSDRAFSLSEVFLQPQIAPGWARSVLHKAFKYIHLLTVTPFTTKNQSPRQV